MFISQKPIKGSTKRLERGHLECAFSWAQSCLSESYVSSLGGMAPVKVQLARGPAVISAARATAMGSGGEEVDGSQLLQAALEW